MNSYDIKLCNGQLKKAICMCFIMLTFALIGHATTVYATMPDTINFSSDPFGGTYGTSPYSVTTNDFGSVIFKATDDSLTTSFDSLKWMGGSGGGMAFGGTYTSISEVTGLTISDGANSAQYGIWFVFGTGNRNTKFSLTSFKLGEAMGNFTCMEVIGFRDGVQVASQDVTINPVASPPNQVVTMSSSFNYVDEIRMRQKTNGYYDKGYPGFEGILVDSIVMGAPVIPSSTISPSTGSFDKNTANQADISTTMTLNGNTLSSITNGANALVSGTDYTVSGSTVTIKSSYLAQRSVGTTNLTFNFSAGNTLTLAITVDDTTPQNSTISPSTRSFDKNTANQVDVSTTMTLNGNVLSSITNGANALVSGTDYTVSSSTVTIKKEYLSTQAVGTTNLTFNFSAGNTQTLAITVTDTTPQNSTISPSTGSFDKNVANQVDVNTTMTLNGNTLSSITNGANALVSGTDYTVSGSAVTIKKEYLAAQAVGTATLTFNFSAGNTQTLSITVTDTTPQNSTISPSTGSFDKNVANQVDVSTTMTLNGNTLSSITNGADTLVENIDYTVSGSAVTIKKEYLAKQAVGTTTLTFNFSAGNTQTLSITVTDTTPQNSTISPSSGSFDKNVANQVDVNTTMTLNGNTLSSITNGANTLVSVTDYTVSGSTVTIKSSYLAQQSEGTTNLTFNFSVGNIQTLSITVTDTTPQNSTISPSTGSFDKNVANQVDVNTTMTLNGNTLSSITNGVNALVSGTDYTVSGSTVTIKSSYLAQQSVGTTNLTFNFSAGNTQTLAITIDDTTPQNSTISPSTGSFDKNTANQADVCTTMTLNGNTLSSITNGANALVSGTDYTVSGSTVTIKSSYLAQQSVGTTNLTFNFSAGNIQTLSITVTNTTPQNSTISPSTGSFDKNVANQADISTTMTLNGNTLSSITNGANTLVSGTDYTVSGSTVMIKSSYLAQQSEGTTNLTFNFSAGNIQTLSITVTDTTPQNSTISPNTGNFDKNVLNQADVSTTMTLNGNTLSGITNGVNTLVSGTDYTVSGSTVTIKKEYLAAQAVGTTTLTFNFSAGNIQTLSITVTDTTPQNSTISPSTGSFDKNVANQADVSTTMTLNGNTLGNITNGANTLVSGIDYTVSGSTVTIRSSYLAQQSVGTTTLTFNFSAGNTQALSITVTDTTPQNSTISPSTGSFDKNTANQADVSTTMILNGNTLSSIANGADTLVSGTDYTVSGSTVTIKKEYLAAQAVGTTALTFNFSAGNIQTLSITVTDTTPQNSTISPSSGSFDKNVANQVDVNTTMTLNGNTLSSITNGVNALVSGTDYTVSGSTVTIKSSYLAQQSVGTTNLTFNFSAGNTQALTITVTDTTPQNSTISPSTGSFDKNTANQADISTTMTLNGNTLSSIINGANTLVSGTDYTVSGSTVTIKKEYLAAQAVGTATLTFNFSAGVSQSLSITINDTTPVNSSITPTSASFDKYTGSVNYVDIPVTMTLNGNTLSSIANGADTLVSGTDYTVSGSTVTIKKEYLAAQAVGTTTLTFNFSSGNTQALTITVTDTTPQNSTISPSTGSFDKNVANQADISTTMTLNGNTLSSITNGANALVRGTDYTVSGSTVTIKKEYLSTQAVGTTNLTFNFSAGNTQTLTITVTDTTPQNSTISPSTGSFDKNVANQADVSTVMTLNGNTLSNITNGADTLVENTDYTVSGSTVTIKSSYLVQQSVGTTTLTFNFSTGNTQALTITVRDTTSQNSTISPSTGSFDKNTANQADVSTTMILNGNALSSITNGANALISGTDYTVSGSTVTIKKEYLAAQAVGTTTLTFNFSAGNTQTLSITVTDTTPQNSTISPSSGSFDKNTANQVDVSTTMILNGNTLSNITNGANTLVSGTDYTVSGSTVTIKSSYLAQQSVGTTTLTFNFSAGNTQTLRIVVIDTIQGQVAVPIAYPGDGTIVASGTTVTLSSTTTGATIYYTTDGTTPTTSSTTGSATTITGEPGATVTIKAIAVKPGMINSNVATFVYTILGYTVTYDGNGNTGGSVPTDSNNYTTGAAITVKDNVGSLVKTGYTFGGWNTAADGSGTNYAAKVTITMGDSNVTLYAKWIVNSSSNNSGGFGGSSGSRSASAVTTIIGSVIEGTDGKKISNITVTVTTDSNGNSTVSMNADQAALLKQPDGNTSQLADILKIAITTEAGSTIATTVNGTIQVQNLAKGTDNNFNITYDLGNGQKITIGKMEIKIDSNGNVSVTTTLIDPYGTIADEATGKVIDGVNVTLYYANTERNKAAGKIPDTIVPLPGIDGFKPNNNKNPQVSDASGEYGFMVFPTSDYYIVATKDGYTKYTSPTISVEQDLVKWNFKMHVAGTERLFGQNRVDTALQIAKATFANNVSNVILASSENYPDALAGSVLAHKLNAPILLVGSDEADQAKVLSYLKDNMNPKGTVYILGGIGAISNDMEARVNGIGLKNITRIGGNDRFETSAKIADTIGVKEGTPIVIVSGENYPDALSISSVAAVNQYPIFMVNKNEIPESINKEISSIKPSKVYIIGADGVISSAVEDQVSQTAAIDKTNIVRIGGRDRFETSLKVIQYFGLSGNVACVASGNNFPDALAGSIYAANNSSPIMLIDNSLTEEQKSYLKNAKLKGVTIFGGTGSISKEVEEELTQIFK